MNDSEKMLHFYWILMFFLTLVLAPSMTGILCKVKALSAGRRGPSIFLPYRELWKLLQKGSVYSSGSSDITRIAPMASLAALTGA